MLVAVSQVDRPARPVGKAFLERLAEDPDVQDWLISVTQHERTRAEYLDYFGRFLHWTGWTPRQVVELKRAALKEGEPISQVEREIKRFHETLRVMGYAPKSRSKAVASIYSYIQSKGYPIPKRLVHLDMSDKYEMRVPERSEVELFVQYASTLERKLLYTMLPETPCRPRVFPAMRWNWLEQEWWTKDIIHVSLPKQFRASNQGGPKKFEPICFLGPRSIELMKQVREARIRAGHPPLENSSVLGCTYDAMLVAIRRDYQDLIKNGLIRESRKDEQGHPLEQQITPKAWRKYQFNIIDALVDISPEWRKMLKGRDLQTERYYSRENVEALRKIYRERIYPQIWSDLAAAHESEKMKDMREEIDKLKLAVRMLEDASHYKVIGDLEVKG